MGKWLLTFPIKLVIYCLIGFVVGWQIGKRL